MTIREAVSRKRLLSDEEAAEVLDTYAMTEPGD